MSWKAERRRLSYGKRSTVFDVGDLTPVLGYTVAKLVFRRVLSSERSSSAPVLGIVIAVRVRRRS